MRGGLGEVPVITDNQRTICANDVFQMLWWKASCKVCIIVHICSHLMVYVTEIAIQNPFHNIVRL